MPNPLPTFGDQQAYVDNNMRPQGPRRTDFAAWDAQLRRTMSELKNGDIHRFAVVPVAEGNVVIDLQRVSGDTAFLDISTVIAKEYLAFIVTSSYARFDQNGLTAQQMVDEHRAWLRTINAVNR